jgi:hypothetical protein
LKALANQGVKMALAHDDGSKLTSLSTSNLQMEEAL